MTQKRFRQQSNHLVRFTPVIVILHVIFLVSFTSPPSYAHISADEAWDGFITEHSSGRINTLMGYMASLADEEAFSDNPQQVQFKKESLQYFLTTGGPNGFLKPENDKRSEEQKLVDQKTLKKAAIYVGVLAKQKEEVLDIFAVRALYIQSPPLSPVQTHLEIVQLIVSSAMSRNPHQKTSLERDSKEHSASSKFAHPLFEKYSAAQLNDILSPHFEEWIEIYQALLDIREYIDPGLTFKALPLKNPSPDTLTKFSLRKGKITWQGSTYQDLTKNINRVVSRSSQKQIECIKRSKINKLSKDLDESVRHRIVVNFLTPLDILEHLTHDEWEVYTISARKRLAERLKEQAVERKKL